MRAGRTKMSQNPSDALLHRSAIDACVERCRPTPRPNEGSRSASTPVDKLRHWGNVEFGFRPLAQPGRLKLTSHHQSIPLVLIEQLRFLIVGHRFEVIHGPLSRHRVEKILRCRELEDPIKGRPEAIAE